MFKLLSDKPNFKNANKTRLHYLKLRSSRYYFVNEEILPSTGYWLYYKKQPNDEWLLLFQLSNVIQFTYIFMLNKIHLKKKNYK